MVFNKPLIFLKNKIFFEKFEKMLDEMAGKAHIDLANGGKPRGKRGLRLRAFFEKRIGDKRILYDRRGFYHIGYMNKPKKDYYYG